jgi:superfamily II DNA or RNA helicase
VACIPSIRGRLDELLAFRGPSGRRGFDVVVADEAHHCAAPATFSLLVRIRCSRRIGLSGTPSRMRSAEDLLLRALFGAPLDLRGASELAREGYISRLRIDLHPVPGPPLPLTAPWSELYEKGIVRNDGRNRSVVNAVGRLRGEGRSVLVLVGSLEHGRQLRDRIIESGHSALFLSAKDSVDRRGDALKDFRSGRLHVLVASEWICDGTDLPDLGACVLACGQFARPATLQRVGRILRKGSESKGGTAVVADFDDRSLHPLLGEHMKKRLITYREMLDAQIEWI